MKQLLIFLIFLPLLGCSNLIENKQTSINFNCPRVFFSSEDRIFIDNSISLDDIGIKAEFNNFAINKQCVEQENIAIIPVDILIELKPINNIKSDLL